MISSGSSLWILVAAVLATSDCYPIHPLAGYIKPEVYHLHIALSEERTFSGVVTIQFKTTGDTQSDKMIVLNGESLIVNSATLTEENGKIEYLTNFSPDNVWRTISFNLQESIKKNSAFSLRISYVGTFSTDGLGLHTLSDLEGFYMTNLRPVYARRLFPCFDSPDKKAIFNFTLDTKTKYAISNTPLLNTTNSESGFRHIFKETPKIPVHSFFFLTGPSEFSTLDSFYWGEAALKVHPKFPKVSAFNAIFEIANSSLLVDLWKKSGMEKLDVLVVPKLVEPFYPGYGVLVLRDELLQFDSYYGTTQLKLEGAFKILEGILQVYYGTVVSPSQWEKNWLTTSIANYLKFRAFSADSKWGDLDEFMLFNIHFATVSTSWKLSSDPVQPTTPFNDTDELERFIAGSSQVKGASVLSMLENVIAVSDLEKSMVEFLTKHKYGDAIDDRNLFDTLSKRTKNLPVKIDYLLNEWITQSGLPLVELSRLSEGVKLTETVYSNEDQRNGTFMWTMPISFISKSNPTNPDSVWFISPNESTMVIKNVSQDDWIVIAANGKSPMVSNYDEKSWYLNDKALKENISTFTPSTRAKLVSDAFRMAKAGKANYENVLDLLRYLDKETSLAPWSKAIEGFKEMYSWIFYTQVNSTFNLKSEFQTYIYDRMAAVYNELGFEQNEEEHENDMLRKEIVEAMCYFGYKPCLVKTKELYIKSKDEVDPYEPPNDMKVNLICAGMRNVQKETDWEFMYSELVNQNLTDPVLDVYLDVLACPEAIGNHSHSIKRYLQKIFLENDGIPVSKIAVAYRAVYTKATHLNQALLFLLHECRPIIKKISAHKLADLLYEITEHSSTSYHDMLLKTFLETHKDMAKPLLDAATLGREKIKNKKRFIMNNMDNIYNGLNTSPTVPPTVTPDTSGTPIPTTPGTPIPTTPGTPIPTTPGTASTAPASPSTKTNVTTTTPVPSTTKPPDSEGLSVGSISLITVGIVIAVAILGLIFYFSCRRGGCCT